MAINTVAQSISSMPRSQEANTRQATQERANTEFTPIEHNGTEEKTDKKVNQTEKVDSRPQEVMQSITDSHIQYTKDPVYNEPILKIMNEEEEVLMQIPAEISLKVSRALGEYMERKTTSTD